MEVYPPDYQIDSEYVAGFQLLRDNVDVALLAFNETGIVLRDVVASTRKEVAFATPPQVFDVPLADGFSPQTTHSCYYCKTQENIVLLNVASIGDVQANIDVVIGTLPAGFRPAVVCRSAATNHFSPYGVGTVLIKTDGTITVRFTDMQSRCNFIASFIATG